MEENNSPYIYEKPLSPRRSKRVLSIASLGLFAVGTAIGGSAFGATLGLGDQNTTETATATDASDIVVDDQTVDPAADASAASIDVDSADPIVSVPLRHAKPQSAEQTLSLPALPVQNYSNLSSATPSAGGSTANQGSAAGYGGRETRIDDDRNEDHESYDDNDDYDDDYEGDDD